jgi:hypothetical protein
MRQRPTRLRLTDALGVTRAVAPGHEAVALPGGSRWLLLGLGPDPAALAAQLPPDADVRYLECPAFSQAAGDAWRAGIPPGWRRIDACDAGEADNILLHTQSLQLFPQFWAPVRAALLLPNPPGPGAAASGTVLMPEMPGSMLAPAIARALAEEGFAVRVASRAGLLEILERERPALFLSVNCAGLDRAGEVQALLARAGVPVATWLADNPFHVLSGVKTPAWRDLHLCVTDDWFVEPLARHGARHVHHLPLAADPAFFAAAPDRPELAGRLLFVGRSAFPAKEAFFAGLSPDPELWRQATAMLSRGERPDYGWWARGLALDTLWPGLGARRVGCGAEESGLAWRERVIREAARTGKLTVCGDAAWAALAGAGFATLPPVPYGPALASLYGSARFVVGAVSPLLPHGLTQRHFDVWAAGGCLLSDATPGLSLFPEELTRPVTYARAQDIPDLARERERDRDGLVAAWRAHIAAHHTYRHRVRRIMECVGERRG